MESRLDFNDKDLREALRDIGSYVDVTEEDLKKIYTLALEHARKRLASSVPVSDVMTRNVITVGVDDDIQKVIRLLSEHNVSGLVVLDAEGRVAGVISEADVLGTVGVKREHTFKDIVKRLLGETTPASRTADKVGDAMSAPPVAVTPETDIGEAARILTEKRIKRLPVVDSERRLIGIVSRADIVRTAQRANK